MSATYLAFRGKFYQQAFGTAMGSPVSVTVANLVLEEVKERALATFQQPPLFWKRYVDDICTALKDSEDESFQQHLNSIEPTIKFTMEQESEGKLPFLDTEITHHEDGTLSTTVYRKKTHTDKYLSFNSHHPLSHRVSVARTLFSRAEKVCSTVGERDDERKHVTDALRANGYPMNIIEMNTQSRQRPRSTDDDREREDPKATVVLPYIRHVSECIRRILTPLDIRTCFKPHVTLRHLLVHPKVVSRAPDSLRENLVHYSRAVRSGLE